MKTFKRKIYAVALLGSLAFGVSSCGNAFLDTDYTQGVDTGSALTSVGNLKTALNGAYNSFGNYRFGAKNVLAISDIASDLAAHNNATTHFKNVYDYTIDESTLYLEEIWDYGYKAVDNSARIIEAGEKMKSGVTEAEKETLHLVLAQAYGLRALASFYMVNIYGVPFKVDGGKDNGSTPGIVVIKEPIKPFAQVSRSSVADTYKAINEDITAAIAEYGNVKGDEDNDNKPGQEYMNLAAVYALQARVALYSQNYTQAITSAEAAIAEAKTASALGLSGNLAYSNLISQFNNVRGSDEDIFFIKRSATDYDSAQSIGTVFGKYGVSANGTWKGLLADTDARSVFTATDDKGVSLGGKYYGDGGNSEVANIPHFRVAELYLILAESNLKKSTPDLAAAKTNLLVVAKRNSAIEDVDDLPTSSADLKAFLENEYARELFWEGHRFFDLRRWGSKASVSGGTYTNYDISAFCFPIPNAEVNSGYGVQQTSNWAAALPK